LATSGDTHLAVDSVGVVARGSRKGTVTNLIRVLEATVKGPQARLPASD
jgi:hypothetical protein